MNYIIAPGLEPKDVKKATINKANIIIDLTCVTFNISRHDLIRHLSKREIAKYRQMAMYVMTKRTKLTLKQIAHLFDGRDHSSVIYARNTVVDLAFTDQKYNLELHKLMRLVDNEIELQLNGESSLLSYLNN